MLGTTHILLGFIFAYFLNLDRKRSAKLVLGSLAPDLSYVQMIIVHPSWSYLTRAFFNHSIVSFAYVLPFGSYGLLGNALHLLCDFYARGIPLLSDRIIGLNPHPWTFYLANSEVMFYPIELIISLMGLYALTKLGMTYLFESLKLLLAAVPIFALFTPLYMVSPYLSTLASFLALYHISKHRKWL